MAGVVLSLLVAGCRPGDDGAALDRPEADAPATTTTTTPATTPSTSDTTTVPAVSSPPGPPAAPEVVLAPDGLGVVRFGDPAVLVLDRLTTLLGAPLDDRPLGSCPTGQADRLVQFAELGVVLAGGEGAAQRFVAWDIGLASGAFPELRTEAGVGVGATVTELRSAYPGAVRVTGDDAFGPSFELRLPNGGVMSGTLTGTRSDDTVVTLGAGEASCSGAEQ